EQVSLRLPRLRRTCRVRRRRVSSIWQWYTRCPGHSSTLVQSVCISILCEGLPAPLPGPGKGAGEASSDGKGLRPRSEKAVARYTDSLKRVKLGGRHTGHLRRGGRAQRGPLQLPPFPSLSALFRTARSGQGRAGFARRSEPLTARTVLEDGGEKKVGGGGGGGGDGGPPPGGVGAPPQFYARERICSPTRKPEIPAKPTFIADSCAQPFFVSRPNRCRYGELLHDFRDVEIR